MFDDDVIVSFGFNGQRSREEAAQALKKRKNDNKGIAIRVQVGVIIQSRCWTGIQKKERHFEGDEKQR